MKIVEPYAHLLDVSDLESGIKLLKKIEWCGRVSHRSEDAQTEDSWKRIIQNIVLEHGDWSIVEHASATVDFLVDRGITHEIVRHRLASYTQESTRFVNYEKKMPPSFICPIVNDEMARTIWEEDIAKCEWSYRALINMGKTPQIARSVFPNALASRLIMTCNLRNWRHFFIMRTTAEAHPQMKQVTIPLLREFQERIPLLYDDIQPGERQIKSMSKVR